MKRVIQRNLQDQLANLLLEGRIHDGEALKVSAGMDGLVVRRTGSRASPRQREARTP
ncbi:hypothetical protein [Belnapia moabensis]|uniref:hypothetical protein n=1 Tax=Belnapia moabensis TaxID=365533 RepID=UPI0024809B23|nr:hypothetical protein [Belnapia moabensis]